MYSVTVYILRVCIRGLRAHIDCQSRLALEVEKGHQGSEIVDFMDFIIMPD